MLNTRSLNAIPVLSRKAVDDDPELSFFLFLLLLWLLGSTGNVALFCCHLQHRSRYSTEILYVREDVSLRVPLDLFLIECVDMRMCNLFFWSYSGYYVNMGTWETCFFHLPVYMIVTVSRCLITCVQVCLDFSPSQPLCSSSFTVICPKV